VKPTSDARSDSDAKPSNSQAGEVLRDWRESAHYWQKHAATIRTMFGPVTQALIEDAGIIEGDAVLDVAGGVGEPSLTIAGIVAPTGVVACTDAAPEMVAAAASEGQRRGLTNVLFRRCEADSLPFEDNSFDSVICRLGAMFFPDPLAALREMLRVTKREGAIALAVWHKSELNPFAYLIPDVLARHFGVSAPADPNAPGAFRFAETGVLAEILSSAGALEVTERVLKFDIAAPISPKEFWEMRSETSGTLRAKVKSLLPAEAALIAQEAQAAVREFFPNNQMRFPAQMIIVSGSKASSNNEVI